MGFCAVAGSPEGVSHPIRPHSLLIQQRLVLCGRSRPMVAPRSTGPDGVQLLR